MTKIKQVTTEQDIETIASLAHIIWKEHYTPIIGAQQVAYMLEKFQSAEAISSQIQEGAHYYKIVNQNSTVGYLSFSKKDKSLFLSKIYLLQSSRGKSFGKKAMEFVALKAKELVCDSISLTVNKNNVHSISAYEKMGFNKTEAVVMDVGGGFVMDDYRMEKQL